ncbi:hypothetical protein ACTXT7_015969 [Hymenolepis weldensis]
MVLYSTQLIGLSLLFTLAQSTINDARIHSSILKEFLVAQSSPESQELAKAVCKVGCLRDCLQNLQTKASKDNMDVVLVVKGHVCEIRVRWFDAHLYKLGEQNGLPDKGVSKFEFLTRLLYPR